MVLIELNIIHYKKSIENGYSSFKLNAQFTTQYSILQKKITKQNE
jgi:hypothetical protein